MLDRLQRGKRERQRVAIRVNGVFEELGDQSARPFQSNSLFIRLLRCHIVQVRRSVQQ